MGSSKKSKGGIIVEWAKHLRPFGKRTHWHKVRGKEKKEIKKELDDN